MFAADARARPASCCQAAVPEFGFVWCVVCFLRLLAVGLLYCEQCALNLDKRGAHRIWRVSATGANPEVVVLATGGSLGLLHNHGLFLGFANYVIPVWCHDGYLNLGKMWIGIF